MRPRRAISQAERCASKALTYCIASETGSIRTQQLPYSGDILEALSVLRDLAVATKVQSQGWVVQGLCRASLFWWLLSPLLAALLVKRRLFFSANFLRIRTTTRCGLGVFPPTICIPLTISIDNLKKRDYD